MAIYKMCPTNVAIADLAFHFFPSFWERADDGFFSFYSLSFFFWGFLARLQQGKPAAMLLYLIVWSPAPDNGTKQNAFSLLSCCGLAVCEPEEAKNYGEEVNVAIVNC